MIQTLPSSLAPQRTYRRHAASTKIARLKLALDHNADSFEYDLGDTAFVAISAAPDHQQAAMDIGWIEAEKVSGICSVGLCSTGEQFCRDELMAIKLKASV